MATIPRIGASERDPPGIASITETSNIPDQSDMHRPTRSNSRFWPKSQGRSIRRRLTRSIRTLRPDVKPPWDRAPAGAHPNPFGDQAPLKAKRSPGAKPPWEPSPIGGQAKPRRQALDSSQVLGAKSHSAEHGKIQVTPRCILRF